MFLIFSRLSHLIFVLYAHVSHSLGSWTIYRSRARVDAFFLFFFSSHVDRARATSRSRSSGTQVAALRAARDREASRAASPACVEARVKMPTV